MDILIEIIVCFIAGMGAGIGTGFAGMSACAVIAPFLVTFLNVPPYSAVGIGLASDVLASAASALLYKKSDNIDLKNGIIMMVCVLIATVFGSYIASLLPERAMSNTSLVAMILIGLRFLIKPVTTTKKDMALVSKKKRIMGSIIGGLVIGFICGFVGAGGGMMMLFILTSFLGYELHVAVGTSVFIMSFTALTGSISHFAMKGTIDVSVLLLCIAFTLLWAFIASKLANKLSSKVMNRIVGIILIVSSLTILVINIL